MCNGVTRGLAGLKFSGSPIKLGLNSVISVNNISKIRNPTRSLIEKYGWNGILSLSLFTPKGLFDPVWCKKTRCTNITAATMNGKIK